MPRFADPSRCPDCASTLPVAPDLCPTCALPLTGPLAAELLRTLRRADDLVLNLRTSVGAESAPIGADSAKNSARVGDYRRRLDTDGGVVGVAEYPPPAEPVARRTGISAPSVPKILLGLGATCLLVAAVIFLAVAWSWLGVGGRTAVLVAATLATGALGVRLARRGLTVAGEALTAVSLGLLVLDLAGAQNAGWLGALEGSGFAVLIGSAVVAAGAGLLAALRSDLRRLVVPQVAVVVGALVALVALDDLADPATVVLALEVLLCAAVVRATLGRRVPVVVAGLAAVGVLIWLYLMLYGFLETVAPDGSISARHLWLDGHGVALLTAIALTLAPIAVAPARRAVWQVALAVGAVLLSLVAVLPVLDNSATAAASSFLVALVVWTATTVVVRRSAPAVRARASIAVLAPLGLAATAASVVLAEMLARAAANVLGAGEPFREEAGVRIDALTPHTHPALVVPLTLALLAAAHVALPWRRFVPQGVAAAIAVSGLATLAQFDVPLWVVVALLAGLGVGCLVDGLRRPASTGLVALGAAVVLLGSAALAALPSAGLTSLVLVASLAAALAVFLLVGEPVGRMAGAALPLVWAGLVWATADAVDGPVAWCAVVVLVAVGLFAIAVPRVEVEVAATVAVLLSAPSAIAAAADESVSLALHLTLAGALVVATSLVHRDRRPLAAPGGLLLAAATWVRLVDLGVSAPEPYTLPTAMVLLAVGLDRIRRDDSVSTTTALLPGLVLGTIPSLLWALEEPVSLRALLLGVACVALALAGARARWSAPILVGASVGAVLVVRELAPYVGQTPQWVVIGLAGTLLTVVGVTWERRLQDVQQAAESLGRLR